jgi:eukaryotic-like serine/threonine-protein kinase
MTPDRLKEIFAQAMEKKSLAEREKFLAEACRGDPELRQQVETLLLAHEQAGDFLGQTVKLAESDFVLEKIGVMIGRYKLLEKIGEGGFGVVYMAEQQQPVQRKVALKIIKAGMDTREVVARFEAERQALALMDHPNIARVLDAGATNAGRPYFVMELVRGMSITDYCDRSNLATRERLQLFMKVCHAVQHAHQKGIIHRDIKPNNVLVTLHDGEPVPKVIDFGIAKALGQKLTEKTLFTGFTHMIGTPAYMSPEQAELSGLDIDTRADIYSLGVLLYELLTGVTPFDRETLVNAALDEIRRMIRETEPPKPSTRLRSLGDKLIEVANRRHTEPAALSRLVRGDLDWIVMKCLEKDRGRRYETASGLANDLQRHLKDEAVVARPPSALYQFQKFARRHQTSLATAALMALLLILGAVVSTWQAVRATRSSQEAERQARLAAKMAKDESEQRAHAENLAQNIRRSLYAARISEAQHAFESGNIVQATELLESLRPQPEEEDLRGFEWYYVWRLCHSEKLNLRGYAGRVRTVAYSPDGSTLASAGDDKGIHVWDSATGQEQFVRNSHTGWVSSVVFSPDGKTLASGGDDKTVKLWRLHSTNELFSFDDFPAAITALAFAPKGDLLAAGTGKLATGGGNPVIRFVPRSSAGIVKILEVATRKELITIAGHQGSILSLAFSPDGRTLVSGSADETAAVWDANTGIRKRLLPRSGGPVFAVAFVAGGDSFITASWSPYRKQSELKRWDAQTFTELPLLKSDAGPVMCLALSPDGRTLATGGLEHIVRLWDVASGRERAKFRGHQDVIWALAFSPDGQSVASASWDNTVKVWDVNRRQEGDLLPVGNGYSVALTPDGKMLACGAPVNGVQFWDTSTRKQIAKLSLDNGEDPLAVFSPDATLLATAGTRGKAFLVDVASKTVRRELPQRTTKIWCMAFSQDGRILATAAEDKLIELWDTETGEARGALAGHSGRAVCLAFTPDGRTLISGSYKEMIFWDLATASPRETVKKLSPHLQLSPNGKILLFGSQFGSIKLVENETRKDLAIITGHADLIYGFNWTSDSRTVVSAAWDGTAKFWQVPGGHLLLTVPSTLGVSWSTAFSADGRIGAVGSGSARRGEVMLLYAATEAEILDQPWQAQWKLARMGRFPVAKSNLVSTIPRRNGAARPQLLDLSEHYNGSLTAGWIPSSAFGTTVERNLGELPQGIQKLADVEFDVRGLIQLGGHSLNDSLNAEYPRAAENLPVKQKCRRLHFLYGTGWREPDGTKIGSYVIHYAGGEWREVSIIYGEDVRDWWFTRGLDEPTTRGAVVWTGWNAATRAQNQALRLYKLTWENPHPELRIESIDFISELSNSSPFLIGITAE